MKKICSAFLVLCICLSLCSCFESDKYDQRVKQWRAEPDEIVYILNSSNGEVISKGKTYNLYEFENVTRDNFIAAVERNGLLYGFLFESTDNSQYRWCYRLCALNLEAKTKEILYERECCPRDLTACYDIKAYPDIYYDNGEIVLYDGYEAIFYDLATGETSSLSADKHAFPEHLFEVDYIYPDNEMVDPYTEQSLSLVYRGERISLTPEYLAGKHNYFKQNMDYNQYYQFGEKIFGFLSMSYGNVLGVVVGDVLYFVHCLDSTWATAIVYSYDLKNEILTPVYLCEAFNRIQVIPRIH